jgi:Putative addiction module component
LSGAAPSDRISRMKVEDITEEALALPSEARALLADRLVESLDPAEDGYIHDLWVSEARARLLELRSGSVEAIPGVEAIAALRKKYAA